MSLYEYTISSNNSINDNKYNSERASKTHYKIKSILKPLLKMLKRSSKPSKPQQQQQQYCTECGDNSANEKLESQLFDEIANCQPNSAIFVCDEEGQWNISPVCREQSYVPVHFARTSAGTFFWTSMVNKCEDFDMMYQHNHCYTECQQPAEQIPMFGQDRWVQA